MFAVTQAETDAIRTAMPDTSLSDLLDLLQQENARFTQALERVARDLSALGERATAAGEVLAGVSSRLDLIERRLGIQKP